MSNYFYEGPSMAVEPEPELKDMYCPLLPGHEGENNFYRRSCETKKRDRNIPECYKVCKAEKALEKIANCKGAVIGSAYWEKKQAIRYKKIIRMVKKGLTVGQIRAELRVRNNTVVEEFINKAVKCGDLPKQNGDSLDECK